MLAKIGQQIETKYFIVRELPYKKTFLFRAVQKQIWQLKTWLGHFPVFSSENLQVEWAMSKIIVTNCLTEAAVRFLNF